MSDGQPRSRAWSAFVFLQGLLFVLLGQRALFYEQRDRPESLLMLLMGVLVLLGLAWVRHYDRQVETAPSEAREPVTRPAIRLTPELVGSAVALLLSLEIALATHDVLAWPQGWLIGDAGWQVMFWLVGMVCFAWLFVRDDELVRWRGFWAVHRDEMLWVGGLVLLAWALRLLGLGGTPWPLAQDEGEFGVRALEVLRGRGTNPFLVEYGGHPNLFFYLQAGALRLLGVGVAGLRLPAALAGGVLVLPVYALGRLWFERRVAWIAALFVAVWHFPLHYSRVGLNPIFDPLLVSTALALLAWGSRGRADRRLAFASAGLTLGLSQYFYVGARLALLLVGFYVSCELRVASGGWRKTWLILLIGFLIAFSPLLGAYLQSPDALLNDARQPDVLQSNWLGYTRGVTGRSSLDLLASQLARAFLAFNYHLDRTPSGWYNPTSPLLDPLSGALWLFGLAVALRGRREPALLAWVAGVIVFGGMLVQDAPSSPHLLLAVPALALLAALGLVTLLDLLTARSQARFRAGVSTGGLIGVCALVLAVNLYFYWGEYAPGHRYGSVDDEVGTRAGEYLAERASQDERIYAIWLGAPRLPFDVGPLAFWTYDVPGHDQVEPLTPVLGLGLEDKCLIFVLLPERMGELDALMRGVPGGRLLKFPLYKQDGLAFSVYEVDVPE